MAYHLGLVSISFRKYSPEEILAAMEQAGLTRIEWGSDVHAPKDNPENLRYLAELQKQYGVTCSSYGSYFQLGTHNISELPEYFQAAKILGTRIIRLWCGEKDYEMYTQTEKEALFDAGRQAAALAEEADVILCMECHNNTYTNRKEGALELMEAVHSSHFRMYWQPNQFREEEENIAYARLLAPYTEHLHVFHWKEHDRFPLSRGIGKWEAYLEQFCGERALLLEFMPDDKLETLQEEADALRMIAGGGKQ